MLLALKKHEEDLTVSKKQNAAALCGVREKAAGFAEGRSLIKRENFGGKAMKKVLWTVLLTALLLCSACGKKAEQPEEWVGVYQAAGGWVMGTEVEISQLHRNGVTLSLHEDGTFRILCDDAVAEGTWSLGQKELLLDAGSGIAYRARVEEDALTLRDGMDLGLRLIFQKEREAAKPGYYVLKSISREGESFDADFYDAAGLGGSYLELREDGTGTLYFSGEAPSTFEWSEEGILTEDAGAVPLTVSGGGILLELGDVVVVFAARTEADKQ